MYDIIARTIVKLLAVRFPENKNGIEEAFKEIKAEGASSVIDAALTMSNFDSFNADHELYCIFSQIYDYTNNIAPTRIRPKELGIENNTQSCSEESLLDKFLGEVKHLKWENTNSDIDTLIGLMNKYFVNIGSGVNQYISFFDMAKTTANIAYCLSMYVNKGNELKSAVSDDTKHPFLLVGGDISGIQNYIYDIPSKKAAKNLKGRSFFVQLLIESIIQKVLSGLSATSASIIYSSGGGFFILVPNTAENKVILQGLEKEIQDKLFTEYGVSIYCAIDSIALNSDDLTNNRIAEKWGQLIGLLRLKKQRRYSRVIEKEPGMLFLPSDDSLVNDKKELDETAELGKQLKDADYWIMTTMPLGRDVKGFCPADLEVWHYFVDEKKISSFLEILPKGSVKIQKINRLDFFEKNYYTGSESFGFVFYGGNGFPIDDSGNPLTFDQLAEKSGGDMARLGVLRMDVDNLGQIFVNGLPKDLQTLSGYSTLSRNLDWFFKGHINVIWEDEDYRNYTQIIYSGGDDLFLVGEWQRLIEMAKAIRNEFSNFVQKNPRLTLSGGLAVISKKYPILRGAFEAGEEEDRAKRHFYDKNEKNAFSLFEFALNWDEEFPFVEKIKEDIVTFIDKRKLPKSFISKVRSHYESVKSFKGGIQPLRLIWLTAYDFQRIKDGTKEPGVKDFVEKCKRGVYENKVEQFDGGKSKYHFLQMLYLASRWAEFELRNIS